MVKMLTKGTDLDIEMKDISVAGRVLCQFDDRFKDELSEMGKMTQDPNANMIKLPNISASIPQLEECIKELQAKGYKIPDFPTKPSTPEEEEIRAK